MKTNEQYGKFISRGEVRIIRTLPGPIERVWDYLTDPDKRARWFAGGPMEPRAGGKIELFFRHENIAPGETPPEKMKQVQDPGFKMAATILRWEPPRVLSYTFDEDSDVTFELTAQGKEVAASVWLYEGDENSPFSIAAYRALGPGEKPSPILYRLKRAVAGGSLTYNLLVKATDQAVVHLTLTNPGAHDRGFQWSTPLGRARAVLPSGVRLGLELPMPADAVGEIEIAFDPAGPADADAALPTVEFQR